MKLFGVEVGVERRTLGGGASPERLQPAAHVICASQGDERVLMDLAGGRYYTLNSVGGRIWELLADGASVPQVVAALQLEYELPVDGAEDRLARDVRALVTELQAAGLVRPSPMTGPARE